MFSRSKLEMPRKRVASAEGNSEEVCSKMQRTRIDPKQFVCFICEKAAEASALGQAMTMQLNRQLNECGHNLNDGKLLAILSGGDVVAQDLKYQHACLVELYNRERPHLKTMQHKEGVER